MSTNEVHRSLHPPTAVGVGRQIPAPTKGAPQSEDVRQRIVESKSGQETLQWFPATPPVLAPYLGNLDEFGNTAIQPGGFFSTDPLSQMAQAGKYWLSGLGLRESFYQSLTTVRMSDTASGSSTLQYYAADFLGKWAVFEVPDGGPAGWLSTEVNVQLGLSPASRTQSPQGNLGAVVNPQANVFGPNGLWMSELAWQQSLLDGRLVLLAGLVDQGNYLDANSYANNSQAQFLNGAFVNSSVLPLPSNNLGLSVQWQPTSSWYVLFGTGANNQPPGQSPFQNLSLHDWSYLLELGLTPKNVLGLGPGVYRLQPFLATVSGQTQAGAGFERAAAARAELAFRLLRPARRQWFAGDVGRRQRAGFRRPCHGRAAQAGRAGSEAEQRFAWHRFGLEPVLGDNADRLPRERIRTGDLLCPATHAHHQAAARPAGRLESGLQSGPGSCLRLPASTQLRLVNTYPWMSWQ